MISPTTSSIWCWPASKARPAGIKGVSLFVVPKILVNADGSLGARNGVSLRLDRAQDGHSRQFHLRDELRRRHRLADRRGKQGHAGHVRDDERGAAWRRRAGPGAIRSRLSERRRLCPRSPAGPRAVGTAGAGQAGRSDHRASRRAPHAAHHPRLQRGGARDGGVDRAEERRRPSLQRSQGSPGGRRSHGADDAGHERRADRCRLFQRGAGAADVWRPRLYRRERHGAVRARCAHRHDL